MNEYAKTPGQLAEELEQTRRDAAQAARGHAAEAASIGRDTVQTLRSEMNDARATGQEAMGTARGHASDLKGTAQEAVQTGKAYAQRAVDATGQKMHDWRDRANALQNDCTAYVQREPVKGALIAAAGGAVLAMVLQAAMRRSRHDYADYCAPAPSRPREGRAPFPTMRALSPAQ